MYSDPAIFPDAEHLFIAGLLCEGLVGEIVSTNWDVLVEKACEKFGVDIRIAATPDECNIAATVGQVSLYKIHGCAFRAQDNPYKYRDFIVVTDRHRTQWLQPNRLPFQDKCRVVLRDHFSLFVGLSAQDFNLQCQILSGAPAVISPGCRTYFSIPKLEEKPRDVLKNVHGDLPAEQMQELERNAVLGIYGKPLLGSLYVYILKLKMESLVAASVGKKFSVITRPLAEYALESLLNQLQHWFDVRWIAAGQKSSEVWRELAAGLPDWLSRAARLFREGLPSLANQYKPWVRGTPSQIASDPNAVLARLDLLMAVFGLVKKVGLQHGLDIALCGSGAGHIQITRGGICYRLHILQSGDLEPLVINAKATGDSAIDVLIFALGWAPANSRTASPMKKYATRRPSESANLYLQDLLAQCASEADLVELFGRKLI